MNDTHNFSCFSKIQAEFHSLIFEKSEEENGIEAEDVKYQKKIDRELGNYLYHPEKCHYQKFQFLVHIIPTTVKNSSPPSIVEDFSKLDLSSPPSLSLPLTIPDKVRYLQIPRSLTPTRVKLPTNLTPYHSLPQTEIDLQVKKNSLRIVVISDTHDRHHLIDQLPPCDLLIHCGDILMKGRRSSASYAFQKYQEFNNWIGKQPARYKIIIAGNHDYHLAPSTSTWSKEFIQTSLFSQALYLCNDFVEIEGLRIFGTPLSSGTSTNRAFQEESFQLETIRCYQEQCQKTGGVDILLSHSITQELLEISPPEMLYLFGHVHEYYGVRLWPTTRKVLIEKQTEEEAAIAVLGDQWLGMSSHSPSLQFDGIPLVVVNSSLLDADYEMKNVPIVLDCELFSNIE